MLGSSSALSCSAGCGASAPLSAAPATCSVAGACSLEGVCSAAADSLAAASSVAVVRDVSAFFVSCSDIVGASTTRVARGRELVSCVAAARESRSQLVLRKAKVSSRFCFHTLIFVFLASNTFCYPRSAAFVGALSLCLSGPSRVTTYPGVDVSFFPSIHHFEHQQLPPTPTSISMVIADFPPPLSSLSPPPRTFNHRYSTPQASGDRQKNSNAAVVVVVVVVRPPSFVRSSFVVRLRAQQRTTVGRNHHTNK